MMMLELKPCPFCGKDAQIAPDEIGSGGQHVPPYHAGCLRGAGCGIAFTADDPDEAIAEWNRRTPPTITPTEVGGLVEKWRRHAENAQRTLNIKASEAAKGHDWVVDTETFRSQDVIDVATALEAQAAGWAADKARIAELEAGLERIINAPLIDHTNPKNNPTAIARALLNGERKG